LSNGPYKTGDPHPNPAFNLTRFVEYDDCGRPTWTSVYADSEAPFRLARLSAQRRMANMDESPRSADSAVVSPPDQHPTHTETGVCSGKNRAE